MPFDPSTAKPFNFDPSTANPVDDITEGYKRLARNIEGGVEAGVNTLAGAIGVPVGIVGTGLSQARQHLLPMKGERPERMEDTYKRIASSFTEPLYEESGEKGQEYTDWINNNIMPSMAAFGLGNMAGIAHGARFVKGRGRSEPIKSPIPEAPVAKPTPAFDPTTATILDAQYAAAPAADAAQVAALEAAMRRRGTTHNENGPIGVDPTGQAVLPDQAPYSDVAQQRQGQASMNNAQRIIEERQRLVEEEMRRAYALDFNAAERARRENAPTGFAEYQAQLRRDAETRQPGNNEPINMPKSPYPVDIAEFPQVLKDPAAPVAGLDMTEHNAARMARPLEQDIANPRLPEEIAGWEGEGGGQAITSNNPAPAAKSAAAWGRMQRGQRGAINPDMLLPGFFKTRMINNGVRLEFKGGVEPRVRAFDRSGKQIGELTLLTDTFEARPDSNYEAGGVHVLKEHRGKGIAESMYKFVSELGGDVQASSNLLPEGRKMWDAFEKKGLANSEWKIPAKQRGAVHPELLSLGLNEKIVDLFKRFREVDARFSDQKYADTGSVGDKAARTRAFNALYKAIEETGTPVGKAVQALNHVADYEGVAALKGPRSQQGNIRPDMFVSKRLQGAMNKFGEVMEKLGNTKVSPYTKEEKVVVDALGERNYVPKGDAPADIIKNALAEGKDGEHLFQNWQSGLNLSAEKVKSELMRGVGRWLNYGKKMGDRFYREHVNPVEKVFAGLNTKDLTSAMEHMRGEMFAKARADISGLSPKAQAAYTALREAFDKALVVTNDSLVKLGKKPLTGEEAYMASMWNGNYHIPILDKKGKLRWYIKVETKAEAQKALEHLRNDPASADLNLDAAKIEYHPVNVGSRVPRDVMGAYQDMLQFFDGDTAAEMKAALEHYTSEKGFTFQQHQKHFENKANVRGFIGDRPWLSAKENARAQAKAQFQYLKEAFDWAPMQEALANVKEVIASPELNKLQPNNMELVKNYTAQTMGVSKNIMRAAEQEMQRFLTDLPAPLMRVLPTSIAKFVHSSKTLTYLTQLGMSTGYAIATPLQAFILGPAWHLKTTGEGFKHNVFETASKALYDFSLGILGHEVKQLAPYDMPMSKLGKEAFKYMEDNGIISQNIFHENHGFGDYPPVHALKSVVGWTISMPEKIARASTFMSFVHHLDASGMIKSKAELFRRAEELTNHVLTDFNREARPLLIDKLGQAGELGHTYKSAIFNQWNNLGVFARDAGKGKPGALLAALFMTGLLGGSNGMPGVNELDALWSLTKEAASKQFPTLYPHLTGVGIKGAMLQKMAEFAAHDKVRGVLGNEGAKFLKDTVNYGLPSAITGSQLASRFSSAIGDISTPLDNLTPVAQTIGNVAKLGKAAINPTVTSIAGAIHQNVPAAIQGAMENQMSIFKTVKGKKTQGYANPAKLEEHQTTYKRTPAEENKRYFGLRSIDEASTKSDRFINNQESARLHQAQDAAITSMFDAIVRKDKPDVIKYARAYFDNNGAENFERELLKKIEGYGFDPEQRAIVKAQSIAALKNIRRYRSLHYGK